MRMETVTTQNGFRLLSADEINFVAGGSAPPAPPIPGMTYDPITQQYEFGTEPSFLGSGAELWGGDSDSEGSYEPGLDYCGSGWSGPYVPDSIAGIDISLACYVHDVAYSADSSQDRADADADFFQNVLGLLVAGGMNLSLATATAGSYYAAVRAAGGEHYDGTGSPI